MANASDSIQVAIRIRPLIKSEKEKNLPIQWGVQQNNIYQIDENGQRKGELYSFDHIFQMAKCNIDIYEEIVEDFIDSALNGLNSTIFAYGQTSSGKTYTMLGTDKDRGLVPLTVDSVFDAVSEIRDRKFLLRVSYVEIYNERINDLLDPSNTDVKIREFFSGTIGLQGVKEEIVSKRERVFELLKIGAHNRHMGSTSSNEQSSRSHSIFKMVIESVEVTDFDDKDMPVQISSINLVDLAGFERVAHTKATGMQLREGGHINKSLWALGLVIRQLSDGQEFANFRNSKLTRLLQHSLGGNAKTLIICTITLTSLEYTNSTLSFAKRAKAVKNKPQINQVVPDSATCKHYALMNTELKERLEEQLKKNKDLERDKENNFRQISRLQEQIQTLEMFLHEKEQDIAIKKAATNAINNVFKQKLEEPLSVVQLTNKFKKREEKLLNKIRSLEEQLKDKKGKTEEKHDIRISTDMQYLQDQIEIDRLNRLMLDDKMRLTSVIEQYKTDSDKIKQRVKQVLTQLRETINEYRQDQIVRRPN